ncbi:tetratricopeptide repeat protein [Alcaligenes sp.]
MREGLEKLLAAGKDNALLRFGLGNACMGEGDLEAAREHLSKAVEMNPRYTAA